MLTITTLASDHLPQPLKQHSQPLLPCTHEILMVNAAGASRSNPNWLDPPTSQAVPTRAMGGAKTLTLLLTSSEVRFLGPAHGASRHGLRGWRIQQADPILRVWSRCFAAVYIKPHARLSLLLRCGKCSSGQGAPTALPPCRDGNPNQSASELLISFCSICQRHT